MELKRKKFRSAKCIRFQFDDNEEKNEWKKWKKRKKNSQHWILKCQPLPSRLGSSETYARIVCVRVCWESFLRFCQCLVCTLWIISIKSRMMTSHQKVNPCRSSTDKIVTLLFFFACSATIQIVLGKKKQCQMNYSHC